MSETVKSFNLASYAVVCCVGTAVCFVFCHCAAEVLLHHCPLAMDAAFLALSTFGGLTTAQIMEGDRGNSAFEEERGLSASGTPRNKHLNEAFVIEGSPENFLPQFAAQREGASTVLVTPVMQTKCNNHSPSKRGNQNPLRV